MKKGRENCALCKKNKKIRNTVGNMINSKTLKWVQSLMKVRCTKMLRYYIFEVHTVRWPTGYLIQAFIYHFTKDILLGSDNTNVK